MSYHWYKSDQHISLKLGGLKISFSNSETASPEFTFGPIYIKILNGRHFSEFGEKFEFWRNPTPWKDCLVWRAELRVLTVCYTPEWARKAHDHWEKARREWNEVLTDIGHRALKTGR